jgi:hypothetical protein
MLLMRLGQTLCVVALYLALPVLPAGAQQLTLSTNTGEAGSYVTVYGTGFYPSTSGFIFFDHNYDFQLTQGSGWKCGYFSDRDCEPWVPVSTDSSGNFTTSISIPPGKKVNFLGAGTYFIAAQLPIGGGSDASVPFKVLGEFGENKQLGSFYRYPTVYGEGFAPYRLDGTQSVGGVWWDIDSDFVYDPDEPRQHVYVLPNGTLSSCPTSFCAVRNPFNGRGGKIHIRADLMHEADVNRSTSQKVEASFTIICPLLGCS